MKIVEGRVAVVTGGAAGIGLGMARAFTEAGMRVVIADIDKVAVDAAVTELRAGGHDVVGVPTDVSRLADVEALAAATLDAFGAVHVLCNNAGVGGFASIADTTIDDWEWMLGIDLWGPIYGVKVFLPLIEREDEGHINSTASLAGLVAGASSAPYNVAKHGVVALMATLERELRVSRSPVRASVLCPGPVNTDVARRSAARRSRSWQGDKVGEKISAALANGMHPDEVGRLVLDAIQRDVFWVLTHPRLLRHLQQQVDEMTTERTLSRLRVV